MSSSVGAISIQPGQGITIGHIDGGIISLGQELPNGASPIYASSAVVANAPAVATLVGAPGRNTYINGFEITGSGATVALPVNVTVTGVLGGTLNYMYGAVAGVLLENAPLVVAWTPALVSSGFSQNIVVTCPALGLGAAGNALVAHGYLL